MNLSSEKYEDSLGKMHKLFRLTFQGTWLVLSWVLPYRSGNGIKRRVLNMFGASCASGAVVYSSVRIFDPRNLVMKENASIGPNAIIHNVAKVSIGQGSVVSQYAHLNSASHDFRQPGFPLVSKPIVIGDDCWIATEAFVGMGVTIADEVVLGARSATFRDILKAGVYGGTPAVEIRKR